MNRRSLRDRNRAAIASDPAAPQQESSAEEHRSTASSAPPVEDPIPSPTTPEGMLDAAPAPAVRVRKATSAAVGGTGRLGIYVTPTEFDDAKAAYLADWNNGGLADTFARWIGAAIDAYAARTSQQRAVTAQPRERSETRTGSTRSFTIATDTLARMRAAVTADQQAGRWPSDSAWCGEAIAAAVDAARTCNGGALPTPPPRLPNRLAR